MENTIHTKTISINKSSNYSASNIQFLFYPTRETLHSNLVSIREALRNSKNSSVSNFILSTNSSLILLLVPLILPIKDRLLIEFCFDTKSSIDLYSENYVQCKNFKDILESSQVLKSLGFDVSFSKTYS